MNCMPNTSPKLVHLFVYKINSNGSKMEPCGTPKIEGL